MRHKLKSTKLNRTSSHRLAMFANMTTSLVMNEQIKTTLPKAKALRPFVEKFITKAKKGTLSARRAIISKIKDKTAAEKLMSVLSNRYAKRPGGYTRIVKAGFRYGDRAPLAFIEFVDRDFSPKEEKISDNNIIENQKSTVQKEA